MGFSQEPMVLEHKGTRWGYVFLRAPSYIDGGVCSGAR